MIGNFHHSYHPWCEVWPLVRNFPKRGSVHQNGTNQMGLENPAAEAFSDQAKIFRKSTPT